jgi:outer membrane protein TolC
VNGAALALLAAVCAGLLSACVLADRPVPSNAAVSAPPAWRISAGPTQPIEREWWRRYGDPVLPGLIDRALANNTDVAIAAARVRDAEAQIRQVRSQVLPSVDASIGAARSRTLSPFGTPTTGWSAEPQVEATWQLDLFGRVRDLTGAARNQYFASEAARDATALAIAASVASSYITLRSLDARLEVARDTLASRSEALRIARSRASAGYTSQLELNQAQAEYESTAQIVPQLEQAIAQQENALSTLLGEAPQPIARGSELGALDIPPIPEDRKSVV